MTRQERLAQIRPLREQGLTYRQIAKRLGLSYSHVKHLASDRSYETTLRLSREAKRRRTGTCVDCGAITRYDGRRSASERCVPCSQPAKHWTADRCVTAIQQWARTHGRPPTANDWLHADPRGRWPNRGSVYRSSGNKCSPFATWNDAIAAAGFKPNPSGCYDRGGEAGLRDRQKQILEVLRASTMPVFRRELAAQTGFNRSTVDQALRSLRRRGLIVRYSRGLYGVEQCQRRAA